MVIDLGPLHGPAAAADGERRRLLHKVGVALVGAQALAGEPLRDGRRGRPAGRVDLVAAQVHKIVREETRGRARRRRLATGHLAKEAADCGGRARGRITHSRAR
eukprot:1192682-Prymnesium_polylepis.1